MLKQAKAFRMLAAAIHPSRYAVGSEYSWPLLRKTQIHLELSFKDFNSTFHVSLGKEGRRRRGQDITEKECKQPKDNFF